MHFYFSLATVLGFSPILSQDLNEGNILKPCEGLRAADVCDGMDYMGLHDQDLMDPSIESLWKDIAEYNPASPGCTFDRQKCKKKTVPGIGDPHGFYR